jgi:hypothetical protein
MNAAAAEKGDVKASEVHLPRVRAFLRATRPPLEAAEVVFMSSSRGSRFARGEPTRKAGG